MGRGQNQEYKIEDLYHNIGWVFDNTLKNEDTALVFYQLQLELYPNEKVSRCSVYNIAHIIRFKDTERSVEMFESIAEKDIDAVWMLGTLLKHSDRDKAIEWFTVGKDRGDLICIHSLGDMYYIRYPTDLRDYTTAYKYYLEAAEKGHVPSIEKVATFNRQGYAGLPISEQKEAEWIEKIPDEKMGHITKYNLAWYYIRRCYAHDKIEKGLNMMQELVEKYQDEDAMYMIGEVYQSGKGGIQKNVPLAKEWYLRGIEGGDYDSCIEMAKLTTGDEHTKYIKKGIRIRNDEHWKNKFRKEYHDEQILSVEVGALKSIIADLDEALAKIEEYEMRPPLIGGRMFREAMARFNTRKNDTVM